MTDTVNWTLTDAWLLTAIGELGRRGNTLTRLIAVADALNHDVATERQASGSLGRLVASDLVSVDAARFRLTPAGRGIYKQRSGGMFELSGSVLRALGSFPLRDRSWAFAPGEYQAAYEAYRRRRA